MKTLLVKTGAVAALGFGLALAVQAPSIADQVQGGQARVMKQAVIEVNPSTNLPSTADVGVSGRDLDPRYTYFAQECGIVHLNDNDDWACDPNTRVQIEPGKGGAFSTPLTVHDKFTGTPGNGEYVDVDCTRMRCVVGVAAEDGGDATTAPISFASGGAPKPSDPKPSGW